MNITVGMTLYRYTLKNGKFIVREGTVNQFGLRTCVNFKDGSGAVRAPRDEDIGVIRPIGHSLWMIERDDAKARRMFIEFEERRIEELEELIRKKREVVRGLKRDA
jgi:hypothetical protein